MKVAVVTDSTADLDPGIREGLGIKSVPLTVTLSGKSYLDGVDIKAHDFYQLLRDTKDHPKTSQPSPAAFQEVYTSLLKDHDHVVSIHISEKMSGTLASAQQAAQMSPDRVHPVDSQLVSMPLGLVVLVAAEMAGAGAGWKEIVEKVEELRTRVNTYFTVATLEYLRRGGRIGRAGALVGSVLQVKPVLTIRDGLVTPLERVRTFDKALSRVTELAHETDGGHGLAAIVGHVDAAPAAKHLSGRLDSAARAMVTQPIGPVVGAHAGPGTVGLACYPAELFDLQTGREDAARAL